MEDFNPSNFKAELKRIQQANKTAEGFHRRKAKPLSRVQQSSIRRGSAGAIRNITLEGPTQKNLVNEMEFDLLPNSRRAEAKIYD